MLEGQKSTIILQVEDGLVRLCEDTLTDTYSIGLRTNRDIEWKEISAELHALLVKELASKTGNTIVISLRGE